MAYDGFGKSLFAKYQEVEMEVAFRTGLAPATVGYIAIGVAVAVVVGLVVAGVAFVN